MKRKENSIRFDTNQQEITGGFFIECHKKENNQKHWVVYSRFHKE